MKIRHCDRCHKEIKPDAPDAVQHEEDFFVIKVEHMAKIGSCVSSWETIEMEVCKKCAKHVLPETEFKGLPSEVVAKRQAEVSDIPQSHAASFFNESGKITRGEKP